MIASVLVLHDTLHDGAWIKAGPQPVEMDAAKAREYEAAGYVDVLSVDGQVEVWQACCNGDHEHG